MPTGYKVLIFVNALVAAAALAISPVLYLHQQDIRERALVTERELALQLRSDPCTARPPREAGCERFISRLTEFVPADFACAVFAEVGTTTVSCERRRLP